MCVMLWIVISVVNVGSEQCFHIHILSDGGWYRCALSARLYLEALAAPACFSPTNLDV